MPTKIEYSVETELVKVFDKVMSFPEFAPFSENDIKVLPCFCIKSNDEGEPEEYKFPVATLNKVSEAMRLFMEAKPHYILVVDYNFWKEAQPDQCETVIHMALRSVEVTVTAKGDVKCKSRPPDVVTNKSTLARYGLNMPYLYDAKDLLIVRKGMANNAAKLLPNTAPENVEKSGAAPKAKTKSSPAPAPEDDPPEENDEDPDEKPRVKSANISMPAKTKLPPSRGRLPAPEPE